VNTAVQSNAATVIAGASSLGHARVDMVRDICLWTKHTSAIHKSHVLPNCSLAESHKYYPPITLDEIHVYSLTAVRQKLISLYRENVFCTGPRLNHLSFASSACCSIYNLSYNSYLLVVTSHSFGDRS